MKQRKGLVNRLRTKYIDDTLIEGEKVLYRTHLSWIPVLTREFPYWIASGIIGGIVWGITNNFFYGIMVLCIVALAGMLMQIRLVLHILAVDIVVTNKCIRYKEGIVIIKEAPTKPLQRVDSTNVDLDKNIWQRILRYGDFTLNSISGEDSLIIKDVSKPRSLKRCVDIACNKYVYDVQNRGGIFGGMPPYGQQPQPATVAPAYTPPMPAQVPYTQQPQQNVAQQNGGQQNTSPQQSAPYTGYTNNYNIPT